MKIKKIKYYFLELVFIIKLSFKYGFNVLWSKEKQKDARRRQRNKNNNQRRKKYHTTNISKKKKRLLKNKTNFFCVKCKIWYKKELATLDHIIPVALGGTNDYDNLQFLCEPCHVQKTKKDTARYNKVMHSFKK